METDTPACADGSMLKGGAAFARVACARVACPRVAFARVACAALLVTIACAGAREAAAATACAPCIKVSVATAEFTDYAPRIVLTGDIQPKFQSNISFRISGKIVQRLVEVGSHVGADQVLARLDPQEQAASLETAKAGLASAEALLTQATVAFERQENLFKSGYTTRPTYDQAQQTARTEQAAVESARATLGTAQEQFGYTDLKAGVAGIVTARNAETGQVIQAGQTVFTLAQDGARDAVFNVYEALLTEPPASEQVKVFLQSDPHVESVGTVREIAPTVDATNGSVKVKVALTSTPPGMSLGAAVVGSGEFKPRKAIVLPRGALFAWNGSPAVWLFDPATQTVAPQTVSIERYADDRLILSSGVRAGEQVVTAGIQFLHPGQTVEAAPEGPAK